MNERPIRITGDAAKKVLDDILNQKSLLDTKKPIFSDVRDAGKEKKAK